VICSANRAHLSRRAACGRPSGSSDRDGWLRISASHRQVSVASCGAAQNWRRSSSRRPSRTVRTAPLPGFIRARNCARRPNRVASRAIRLANHRCSRRMRSAVASTVS
jgi:hypothetical protein